MIVWSGNCKCEVECTLKNKKVLVLVLNLDSFFEISVVYGSMKRMEEHGFLTF